MPLGADLAGYTVLADNSVAGEEFDRRTESVV
jgi:hypothetical protein